MVDNPNRVSISFTLHGEKSRQQVDMERLMSKNNRTYVRRGSFAVTQKGAGPNSTKNVHRMQRDMERIAKKRLQADGAVAWRVSRIDTLGGEIWMQCRLSGVDSRLVTRNTDGP